MENYYSKISIELWYRGMREPHPNTVDYYRDRNFSAEEAVRAIAHKEAQAARQRRYEQECADYESMQMDDREDDREPPEKNEPGYCPIDHDLPF
jgi:hypothetical protein